MKSQWACKKCGGKFETMADFKYHACVPKMKPASYDELMAAVGKLSPEDQQAHHNDLASFGTAIVECTPEGVSARRPDRLPRHRGQEIIVIEELEFTVEEWLADESARVEMLARCANSTIGKAAFREAVNMRPNAVILLRHGARVIERYPER